MWESNANTRSVTSSSKTQTPTPSQIRLTDMQLYELSKNQKALKKKVIQYNNEAIKKYKKCQQDNNQEKIQQTKDKNKDKNNNNNNDKINNKNNHATQRNHIHNHNQNIGNAYLSQSQRLLQYMANCGANIDKQLFITVLNNIAWTHQINQKTKYQNKYIECIVYNLNKFITQLGEFTQFLQFSSFLQLSTQIMRKYKQKNRQFQTDQQQQENLINGKILLLNQLRNSKEARIIDFIRKIFYSVKVINYSIKYCTVNSELGNRKVVFKEGFEVISTILNLLRDLHKICLLFQKTQLKQFLQKFKFIDIIEENLDSKLQNNNKLNPNKLSQLIKQLFSNKEQYQLRRTFTNIIYSKQELQQKTQNKDQNNNFTQKNNSLGDTQLANTINSYTMADVLTLNPIQFWQNQKQTPRQLQEKLLNSLQEIIQKQVLNLSIICFIISTQYRLQEQQQQKSEQQRMKIKIDKINHKINAINNCIQKDQKNSLLLNLRQLSEMYHLIGIFTIIGNDFTLNLTKRHKFTKGNNLTELKLLNQLVSAYESYFQSSLCQKYKYKQKQKQKYQQRHQQSNLNFNYNDNYNDNYNSKSAEKAILSSGKNKHLDKRQKIFQRYQGYFKNLIQNEDHQQLAQQKKQRQKKTEQQQKVYEQSHNTQDVLLDYPNLKSKYSCSKLKSKNANNQTSQKLKNKDQKRHNQHNRSKSNKQKCTTHKYKTQSFESKSIRKQYQCRYQYNYVMPKCNNSDKSVSLTSVKSYSKQKQKSQIKKKPKQRINSSPIAPLKQIKKIIVTKINLLIKNQHQRSVSIHREKMKVLVNKQNKIRSKDKSVKKLLKLKNSSKNYNDLDQKKQYQLNYKYNVPSKNKNYKLESFNRKCPKLYQTQHKFSKQIEYSKQQFYDKCKHKYVEKIVANYYL